MTAQYSKLTPPLSLIMAFQIAPRDLLLSSVKQGHSFIYPQQNLNPHHNPEGPLQVLQTFPLLF